MHFLIQQNYFAKFIPGTFAILVIALPMSHQDNFLHDTNHTLIDIFRYGIYTNIEKIIHREIPLLGE